MKPIPTEIVFLAAKRTPSHLWRSLKDPVCDRSGVHAAKAALAQAGVKPEDIDNVVFGNVVQTSRTRSIWPATWVEGRGAQHVPALTVKTGSAARASGRWWTLPGNARRPQRVALVGGPRACRGAPCRARPALRSGAGQVAKLEDTLWEALTDSYTGLPMAMTAENLATKYGISQKEVDE